MNMINSVNGAVDIEQLGIVAPHEHIFIDITNQFSGEKSIPGIDGKNDNVDIKNIGLLRRNCYLIKDNLIIDSVEDAIRETLFFKQAGGKTIVDLTPVGISRDVHKLKQVSDATGLNIITCCGLYTNDTIPESFRRMDVYELAEHFVSELTVGIGSTEIKAGVIGEIGTSEVIFPDEEKSLRAAAIASKKTGVPIYVHIYPWSYNGEIALDIIESYGVEASSVCICHVDVKFDYDYMIRLLKRGAYIEFDDFGKEFYIVKQPGEFAGGAFASDIERVRMLMKLCEQGFEKNILLANDVCLKILLRSYGGWGYDHVHTNIVPMMLSEGFDSNVLRVLIEKNPALFLTNNR